VPPPPTQSKSTRSSPLGQSIFNTQAVISEKPIKSVINSLNGSTVCSSRNSVMSLNSKTSQSEEKAKLQEEYNKALELGQKLAVNANKFRKSKFLLLFSIQEKDEDRDEPVGHLDNSIRKKIMSVCYTQIKTKMIGPNCQKGSFIISNKKLMGVIHDIYKIRKSVDVKWIERFNKEVERCISN